MNWTVFLAGLIIGFLLNWLLDYFFWRKRRICTEAEQSLSLKVGDLQTANASLEGNLATLRGDLNAKDVTIGKMEGKLNALAEYESKLGAKGWTLGGFMAGLFGSKLWNSWSSQEGEIDFDADYSKAADLDVQLSAQNEELAGLRMQMEQARGLQTNLDAKDSELGDLRTQLGAIPGLRADLDARNAELGDLRAQLGTIPGLRADLDAKNAELGDLQAQLGTIPGLRADLDAKNAELGDLRAQLGTIPGLRADLDAKDVEISDLRAQLEGLSADRGGMTLSTAGAGVGVGAALGAAAGFAAAGSTAPERDDNYTRLWGIGPKINGLLKDAGLRSFRQLADTETEQINSIMSAAGPRFQLSSSELQESWRVQADLAADERWTELDSLKAELAEGRHNKENLRHIWGLGAKAETMLNTAGISSISDLLGAGREKLSGFVSFVKPFYGEANEDEVYDSVKRQAELAGGGRWVTLNREQRKYRNMRSNDFTQIWGVGRKAQGILRGLGITSFEELANSDQETISEALVYIKSWYGADADEGEVYDAVIAQARLAGGGEWDALEEVRAPYRAMRRSDDLKVIWGIGPKIEQVLNRAGIRSFAQLAQADTDRLGSILESAGSRFSLSVGDLRDSWREQSGLAASGQWEALDEMQASLKWGDFDDDPND